MESFFLAETTKYLYLLFDPDNFIHNNGSRGTVIQTPNGECVIDAGGYFFTSEAHPIDAASVYCCSTQKKQDDAVLQKMHDNLNLLSLFNIEDEETRFRGQKLKSFTQDLHGDKLGELSYELPSDGLSSENGFQNSVIEILSNYLKTSDNADNTLLKLGASLELLKSQISKLESTKSKDTENFMSDVEVEVDLRKTTNGENVEGSVGSKDSMKSESVSYTEQQKADRQFKPEPPIPTSKVVPVKAEAPPSGLKEEIVKGIGDGTDLSTDGDSLEKDKTVEHHEIITNDSKRIQSESENRNMQQAEAPKTVVLSVKTDSTGQASVQTSDKVQSNAKHVHHINNFKTVKKNNLFNLESLYNILGTGQQKETVPNPNIYHLYQTINHYPLQYLQKPELMVCKAQPFHMRLSVRGEMFTNKDTK